MDSRMVLTAASLTDDLVVEILCRLPFDSFCRFKCVCKAWLAFYSDPHYRQKLPKRPTGFLHEGRRRTGIHLVGLSPNNEEIDGALTFLPQYKHLEVVDCCNGLVLCKYENSLTFPCTCRLIVCNPATQEWRDLPLPESHRHRRCGADFYRYNTILAFDPSWLAQSFYVFIFRESVKNRNEYGINRLEAFSSDQSTWLVDDAWSWNQAILVSRYHSFIGGTLRVQTSSNEILVVDGLHRMSSGMSLNKLIIKLPGDPWCLMDGCIGQSSRSLMFASPEECGRTVSVFSLHAGYPYKWSLKHLLIMPDALGRDVEFCDDGYPLLRCSYEIVALEFEREVLFLVDKETKQLFSYNITTGKLSGVQNGCLTRPWDYHYYVACYSRLPGRAM